MSKILEFFKAKKLEKKFSRLGNGHRLGDPSSDTHEDHGPRVFSDPANVESEAGSNIQVREPSKSTSKAGEAALERLNRQNKPPSAIRNTVWREMQDARQTEREAENLRGRFSQNVITVEKPCVLSRVLFWCPALFGHSVIGPREEVDLAIHQRLLEESVANFPEAATLIFIRGLECSKPPPQPDVPLSEQPTYSEWRDKRKQNLSRVLTNLITSPDNATYRRLRIGNQLVSELLSIDGTRMFLEACGFVEQTAPVVKPVATSSDQPESSSPSPDTEPFLVISEDNARNSEHLQKMLELINTAEPIIPILYRDTKVFLISGSSSLMVARDHLPDDFFNVTKEEVKRILEQQQRIIEESGMLLTKAMRERLRVQDIRLFRYVLIRVRFSCSYIIQGTFYAHDKLGVLRSWITDCLADPSTEYQLWAPPGTVPTHARAGVPASGRVELTNNVATLTELGLAPSSLLNISFPQSTSGDSSHFLRPDLLNSATNM